MGRYVRRFPGGLGESEIDAMMSTFGFGNLLIQVHVVYSREPLHGHIVFPFQDRRFLRCWPMDPNRDLAWPPSVGITFEEFPVIAGPDTKIAESLAARNRGSLTNPSGV